MRIDPQILAQHIPEAAVNPLSEWLLKNKVQLRISRARATKLGDFRAPKEGDIPRISVNHNLNHYAFLITLVHEMAHVESWRNRSFFRREKPHGKKWKATFAKLMEPFLNESIFPKELLPVVKNYFANPKASSSSDSRLMLALKAYDKKSTQLMLNDFEPDERFVFRNIPYQIIKKQRTRFQCKNLQNGRLYLIHGLAEVEKFTD